MDPTTVNWDINDDEENDGDEEDDYLPLDDDEGW